MRSDQRLADLAALCGVFPEFTDLSGDICATNPETQRALIKANGLEADTDRAIADTLALLRAEAVERLLPQDVVVTCEQRARVPCACPTQWQVVLEGSQTIGAEGKSEGDIELPGLPAGVHELIVQHANTRQSVTLIAAPERAPSLQDIAGTDRIWGVVTTLYGIRSDKSRGLGSFDDLARLGEVLGAQGAGFIGINPVHAFGWGDGATISPYSPTHRGFLNINHICMDEIPQVPVPARSQAGDQELIDYRGFGQQHRAALRAGYAAFQSTASPDHRADLQGFTQAGGCALADFALFETLSETHGPEWREWPDALRQPNSAYLAVPDLDVTFHIWLQWLAARQLAAAQQRSQDSGMALGLYLDLAVGARLDGAEAWAGAQTLARGVSLGAPPDHLSPAGQNWQLAAYAPRLLRAHKYAPFRQVLWQVMQHCGVLRIDHALGLNRSYWIPDNGAPGGYIRQPFQSLMAIIAIEAQRAGTVIIGEDLGLVPDGFRETMMAKGLYSYTVVQYEKTENDAFRKARDLRPQSLACFGTHDTPTVKGFWDADDIAWWHRLGWINQGEKTAAQKRRAREKAALMGGPQKALPGLDACDLADRVHGDLAMGPTALVAVQLDDVIGVRDAQNLPGTIDEHPNWRRKLPLSIAELAQHTGLRDTATVMAQAGRSTRDRKPRKEQP
ncbi:4-alpha-glucanotransferase [Roseobacter fucihabitans]|uniref:4-alpha-glucanotransferase n=1 Tax=Roseobacter fucihabitans TaxID=1537242 RepID=A0ABZ2BT78_9RHOB|nr:4-alpha-glucanotransferase [Roseobacter litoralis]MBC6964399.1 4-alpha-glucanotransferase [Roseobacter litoralis]